MTSPITAVVPAAIPAVDPVTWWADVLRLNPVEDGRDGQDGAGHFVAEPGPQVFPRLYGGTLVGQSIVAAATCTDPRFDVAAVHTRYGNAGDPALPIEYRVERQRDSRTLAARAVRAEQAGRVLAWASVSFHDAVAAGDSGIAHELGGRPAPAPEGLPTRGQRLAQRFGEHVPTAAAPVWPVDTRYVDRAPWDPITDDTPRDPTNRVWLRALGSLPDVPAAHAAALGYASDFPMFEPVLFPHDVDWEDLTSGRSVYGASLDHAIWLHRPPRFDEWLLLDQVSPIAARARGFCRAELRTAEGLLVATLAQDVGFVRPRG